jgi:3D (Asp-Asp-Asp) domain-containing protein
MVSLAAVPGSAEAGFWKKHQTANASASAKTSPRPAASRPAEPDRPRPSQGLAARHRPKAKPDTAVASTASSRRPSRFGSFHDVRTTAYTHAESDHLAYGCRNAIGTTLRCSTSYTSAAADWSRFPVGTKFQIVGQPTVYVIDDYGSALVGTNTIDLYKPNHASMNQWGVRHVRIKVLSWGSFERARAHLAGLQNYSHCRRMYQSLRS